MLALYRGCYHRYFKKFSSLHFNSKSTFNQFSSISKSNSLKMNGVYFSLAHIHTQQCSLGLLGSVKYYSSSGPSAEDKKTPQMPLKNR
eukprot:Pgem_evm1s13680